MAYGNWHGAVWRNVWANPYYSIDVQWDYCQDIEANKTKISMMAIRLHRLNLTKFSRNGGTISWKRNTRKRTLPSTSGRSATNLNPFAGR